jgi:hypothetical protein
VGGLGVGGGLVAVAEVLRQVLGEVADAPAGVPGSGQDALGVEPGAEPRTFTIYVNARASDFSFLEDNVE